LLKKNLYETIKYQIFEQLKNKEKLNLKRLVLIDFYLIDY